MHGRLVRLSALSLVLLVDARNVVNYNKRTFNDAAPRRKLQMGTCPSATNIQGCGIHGKCAMLTTTVGTCLCDAGFEYKGPTGVPDPADLCNIPVDICSTESSKLCLNEGTCTSKEVSPFYECTCHQDYSGTNCQNFNDPCAGTIIRCFNEGTCVYYPYNDQRFICECPRGFEGPHCETKVEAGVGGLGVPLSQSVILFSWVIVAFGFCLWVYCLWSFLVTIFKNCSLPFV